MDIGTKIYNYIEKNDPVRPGQLMKYFTEGNFKERVSKGAKPQIDEEAKLKKSGRTIFRKLNQMTKEGLISVIDSEEAKRYGIVDPDRRAKYLILTVTVEKTRHLDLIFELFTTGDNIDIKMVLREIKRYGQKYFLSPSQLDILVSNLNNKDPGIIEDILDILYNHIIKRKIGLEDETVFLDTLRSLLELYIEGHKDYTKLRSHIIWFLGYYKDKAVIEQLKRDIEAGRLSEFEYDYSSILTAKVIEESRTELFYLENRLRKEGDTKTADILDRIRMQAATKAEMPMEQETQWNFPLIRISNTITKGV